MNDAIQPGSDGFVFPAPGSDSLPVFERLGIIVRALHDTLCEIGTESALADAASEFPSARERLLHIASLTENAANIVPGKVEENVPRLEQLAGKAAALELSWAGAAAPATPEQAQLIAATRGFLAEVQTGCGATRLALSDIMMAQDFQDLTG